MKPASSTNARKDLQTGGAPLTMISLALLVLASVFQGTALFSLRLASDRQVGIAPYWILAALALAVGLTSLASSWRNAVARLARPMRWAAVGLSAFALYAVLSAFTLPFIFRGIPVLNPHLGIDAQFMDPSSLAWSLSNAGQAGYTLLNLGVFWLLALRVSTLQQLRVAYRFVLAVGWLVLASALFQHVSTTYLPNRLYPALYAVTHNNPAASSYPAMDPRTTSFFLEPSFLGGFTATLFAMGLGQYFQTGQRSHLALGLGSAYVTLTSESTVGLALIPLGLMLALLPSIGSRTAASESGRTKGIGSRLRNVLLGLICAIAVFTVEQAAADVLRVQSIPALTQSAAVGQMEPQVGPAASSTASHATPVTAPPTPLPRAAGATTPGAGLLDLGSRPWSDRLLSVKYRLWADQFSIFEVTKATWFLGAGLGSNRPSSFLAYVASDTGVPGLLAFAVFLAPVIVKGIRNRRVLRQPTMSLYAGMLTYLLAMFGGLPDPNWPPFLWIYGGLVVAALGLALDNHHDLSTPSSIV
jgi:hypothetical protein